MAEIREGGRRWFVAFVVALTLASGVLTIGPPGPLEAEPARASVAFRKGVYSLAGGGDPATTERGCETYGDTPPDDCAEAGYVDAEAFDARFSSPSDVALSADERTLYIADTGNNAIRRLDGATNTVTTCVRDGDVFEPQYLVVDESDTVYVVVHIADVPDSHAPNSKILRIRGCGAAEVLLDDVRNVGGIALSDGKLWAAVANEPWHAQGGVLVGLDPNGNYHGKDSLPAPAYGWGWSRFWYPGAVAAYPNGDIFLDGWRIDPDTREATELPHLTGNDAAVDDRGQLYLSHGASCPERGNFVASYRSSILDRKIVAGVQSDTWGGGYEDGSPGEMCNPSGIAITRDGSSVFVADRGNHAVRQIKVTRPSRYRFGFSSAFGYASDPVNTYTGNYVEQHVDLAAPPGTYGMDWGRAYNHQDESVTALGRGWSHTFSARVLSTGEPADTIDYVAPDGRAFLFERTSPTGAVWTSVDGIRADLVYDTASQSFSLVYWNGERHEFDADGRVVRLIAANGTQRVDVTWNGGVPVQATSSTGYGLSFADDDVDGFVDGVTTSDGRSTSYTYSEGAFLTSVSGPVDGMRTRYVADELQRVREVWQNAGDGERALVVNEYDDENRVVVQYSEPSDPSQADPGGDRSTFAYDTPEVDQTSVTGDDREGTVETIVYRHDEDGLLIGMTDPFGQAITRSWSNEQPDETTDRIDATYKNQYDDRGRLCKRWLTDPDNGGIGTAETYRYEGQEVPCASSPGDARLVEHVDANGVSTRYEYDPGDDDDVPTRIVEAAGTDVEAVTHVQSSGGLVQRSTDPDGVVTEFSWDVTRRRLLSQTTGGRTTWFGYDAAGRQNVVRSPMGNETWTVFDGAGRPVEEVGPVHVERSCSPSSCPFDGPPAGDGVATMRFEYWPDGSLKSRTDPAGNVWRFDTTRLPGGGREERTTDPEGNVSTSRYDRAGRMVETTAPRDAADPAGASTTTRYTYGPLGRLVRTTDPTGRQTHHCYEAGGRVTITATGSLPDGEVIDCATPQPQLIWSSTTYDKRGRVTRSTTGISATEAGLETVYVYDESDRVVETIGPAAPSVPMDARPRTASEYDARGRTRATVDALGRRTETTLTRAGRTAATLDLGTGLRTASAYDPVTGELIEARGPVLDPAAADAPVTRYRYDEDGRVAQVVHPDGTTTETLAYDAAGRVLQSRDAAGVVTSYEWTARGDLARQVTAPETDDAVDMGYPAHRFDGQVVQVRDGSGNLTSYSYSARGARIARTDALANVERWSFDAAGREIAHTDALGRVTTTTYDERGRRSSVATPDGRVAHHEWTSTGQPRLTRYEHGSSVEVVTYEYDELGRRAAMTDATGTTTYAHDVAGNLVASVAPGDRSTAWSYDAAGRRAAMDLPDGTVLDYRYDPTTGRLSTVSARHVVADTFTAADGSKLDSAKWTTSGTSGEGAVVQRSNALGLDVGSAGGTASLQFKASPKLEHSSTSLRYRFDAVNADAALTVQARQSSSKNYRVTIRPGSPVAELWRTTGTKHVRLGELPVGDGEWNRVRLEVNGTSVRARAWADGQPEPDSWGVDVTDSAVKGAGHTSVAFNAPAGASQGVAIDDVTIGDPSVVQPTPLASYEWDSLGRLRKQTTPDGFRSWTYAKGRLEQMSQDLPGATGTTVLEYDDAGRIASETSGDVPTRYGYDGAGQLTLVERPDSVVGYTYDELGRRQTKSVDGVATTYAYDAADQLRSTSGGQKSTFTWDAAGRMLTAKVGSTTATYGYDAAGRLQTAKRGGSQVTRTVNGDGQLTTVTAASGATTRLDWDVTRPVPEAALLTTTSSTAVAMLHEGDQVSAMRTGDDSEGMPSDIHGSALKTSATNGIAAAPSYDEFGIPETNVNLPDVRFGFRGELAESGLIHLRARQYNPSTGSFTTTDPLDGVNGTPTVSNPYHYADNDPIDNIDPLGLRPNDGEFAHECSASTLSFWFPVDEAHRWLGEIHVAGFIPQFETSLTPLNGPGPRYFLGDNRRFTPAGAFIRPERNRFFAVLDFSIGMGWGQVNPTHRSDRDFLLAPAGSTVAGPLGGAVGAAETLVGDWGRCSAALPITYGAYDGNGIFDSAYQRNYMLVERAGDTYRFKWSVVQSDQGFGQSLMRPRADGNLDLRFVEGGGSVEPSWSGDCFPSVEVMRVTGGSSPTTQVIGRVRDAGALAMTGGVTSVYNLIGAC